MNKLLQIILAVTLLLCGLAVPQLITHASAIESVLAIKHDFNGDGVYDSGKIGRKCTFYDSDNGLDYGRRVAVCAAKRYINHVDNGVIEFQGKSQTGYYINVYVVCYVGTADLPCDGVAFVKAGNFDSERQPSIRLSCGTWEDTDDPEHGAHCGDPAGGAIWNHHASTTVVFGDLVTWPGWYSVGYYVHVQLDDGQRINPLSQWSISNEVFDFPSDPTCCAQPQGTS